MTRQKGVTIRDHYKAPIIRGTPNEFNLKWERESKKKQIMKSEHHEFCFN